MTRLGVRIEKAWWHNDRHGERRIHFTARRADGSVKHLYADRGVPGGTWELLRGHLDAIGYEGPGDGEPAGKPGKGGGR